MSRPQEHKAVGRSAVRRRLVPAVLGLGAVLALAGCDAGQTTQTANQVSAVDGASAQSRGIDVRDAQMTYPAQGNLYRAGSSAPLQLLLINQGTQSDRLVSVSSPYATSALVGGTTVIAPGVALRAFGTPAAEPSSSASSPAPSSSPSSSAASSSPAAPTSQPAGSVATPGPTEQAVNQQTVQITLAGLKQDITPGVTIPVTFVFEHAGPITVQMPMGTDPRLRSDHP